MPDVKCMGKRIPFILRRKINQHGCAASQRRSGTGCEIVGGHGTGNGHIEMGVPVDKSRKYQTSSSVNRNITLQIVADGLNPFAFYEQVGFVTVIAGYKLTIFNDGCHSLFLLSRETRQSPAAVLPAAHQSLFLPCPDTDIFDALGNHHLQNLQNPLRFQRT